MCFCLPVGDDDDDLDDLDDDDELDGDGGGYEALSSNCDIL